MSSELVWTIVIAVVMVIGLAGVAIPVLPGLALVWAAALVYGFAVGFGWQGIGVMVLLSTLLVASVVKGVIVPKRAVERVGGSGWSQLGGLVGALIGLFTLPVIGVPVGALIGVMAVEYVNTQSLPDAWVATKGVAKGFGINALIDLGIGVAMIGAWSLWALSVVVG